MKRLHLLIFSALLLAACASPDPGAPLPANVVTTSVAITPTLAIETPITPAPDPVVTTEVVTTLTPLPQGPGVRDTPSASPLPPGEGQGEADWRTLPIIPPVSQTARQIYQQGLALGRDPHAFSKVGDCQFSTDFFFINFDLPGHYNLGEYSSLQTTIDWFAGSFGRWNVTIADGFNAAAVLSPLRADPEQCQPGETPLACEFRLHNPSLVLISLEKWWGSDLEKNERYMRQIIELSIQAGILPILATKADNLEGDHSINQTIARLAQEYDIPLWNFWLAVQPLPNHGVQPTTPQGTPDLFHLTYGNYYDFSVPEAKRSGWTVRNLTALQMLEAVWLAVSQP